MHGIQLCLYLYAETNLSVISIHVNPLDVMFYIDYYNHCNESADRWDRGGWGQVYIAKLDMVSTVLVSPGTSSLSRPGENEAKILYSSLLTKQQYPVVYVCPA